MINRRYSGVNLNARIPAQIVNQIIRMGARITCRDYNLEERHRNSEDQMGGLAPSGLRHGSNHTQNDSESRKTEPERIYIKNQESRI